MKTKRQPTQEEIAYMTALAYGASPMEAKEVKEAFAFPRTMGAHEAAARLTEAAPELFEALRKLLRHSDQLGGGCSASADIAQAKRAIARATGQTED